MKFWVRCLVVVFITFWMFEAQTQECDSKCYQSADIVECQYTRRLGGRNCAVRDSCTLRAVDPDGPGGNPPTLVVLCDYYCEIEYCVWV